MVLPGISEIRQQIIGYEEGPFCYRRMNRRTEMSGTVVEHDRCLERVGIARSQIDENEVSLSISVDVSRRETGKGSIHRPGGAAINVSSILAGRHSEAALTIIEEHGSRIAVLIGRDDVRMTVSIKICHR